MIRSCWKTRPRHRLGNSCRGDRWPWSWCGPAAGSCSGRWPGCFAVVYRRGCGTIGRDGKGAGRGQRFTASRRPSQDNDRDRVATFLARSASNVLRRAIYYMDRLEFTGVTLRGMEITINDLTSPPTAEAPSSPGSDFTDRQRQQPVPCLRGELHGRISPGRRHVEDPERRRRQHESARAGYPLKRRGHQPSAISFQLSAVSYQHSAISSQPSTLSGLCDAKSLTRGLRRKHG